MAKLSEDIKDFIVQRLACFDRPQDVADAVGAEFGLKIDRRQVEEYDPEKRCKTAKWVELHAATRKAFLERKAGLAITHRSWRLRELQEMARAAKKVKNYKLAAELLKQAAEEEGEVYVNHRSKEPAAATEEERIARMRAAIAGMDTMTTGDPLTAPSLAIERGGAAA